MRLPKLKLVDRRRYLVSACRGKSVLHLGCAESPMTERRLRDGTHMHAMLSKVAKRLVGIDMDGEALELLRREIPGPIFEGDACRLEDLGLHGDFNVVVAGELIEHLGNPMQFLEQLAAFMSKQCILIITTPNAFALKRWLRFIASGRDEQDPSHVSCHTFATLRRLVETSGFSLLRWTMGMSVQLSGRSRATAGIFKAFCWLAPRFGDTHIVEAVKA